MPTKKAAKKKISVTKPKPRPAMKVEIEEPAPAAAPIAETASPSEPKVVKVGGKYVLENTPAAPAAAVTPPAATPAAPEAPAAAPTASSPAPVAPTVSPTSPVTSESKESPDINRYTLSENVPLERINNRMYLVGIIALIAVVVSTVALYYARMKLPPPSPASDVTTVESSPAAAADAGSPAPESTDLAPADITLEILNGTKTPGLAGKTAAQFETLGYKVVKTGNSPEDATENKLLVNKDVEDKLGTLLKDVASTLSIASPSGYLTGSTASARIILGGK